MLSKPIQAPYNGSRPKEKPPEKNKSSQSKTKPYTNIRFNEIDTRKSMNASKLKPQDLKKLEYDFWPGMD